MASPLLSTGFVNIWACGEKLRYLISQPLWPYELMYPYKVNLSRPVIGSSMLKRIFYKRGHYLDIHATPVSSFCTVLATIWSRPSAYSPVMSRRTRERREERRTRRDSFMGSASVVRWDFWLHSLTPCPCLSVCLSVCRARV